MRSMPSPEDGGWRVGIGAEPGSGGGSSGEHRDGCGADAELAEDGWRRR